MQDTIERAKKVGYYIGKTIKEKNGENKVKSYKNKIDKCYGFPRS